MIYFPSDPGGQPIGFATGKLSKSKKQNEIDRFYRIKYLKNTTV